MRYRPLLLTLMLFALLARQPSTQAQEAVPVGNITNGLVIYQQRCANCHGFQGLGDGELAAQAVNPPPAIGSTAYHAAALPQTMFDVITNGRLEQGMPLFGEGSSNPLSVQERWDLIGALYALGNSAENTLLPPPTLTLDPLTSNNQMAADALAAQGITDAEIPDLVNAWRMNQFNYWLGAGVVNGTVLNGTTNQLAPDLVVNLTAFEGFEVAKTLTATTQADGSYQFTLDQIAADWLFRTSLTYTDQPYGSEIFLFPPTMQYEQTLTVYDTIEDPAAVQLNQLNTIVEAGTDQLLFNQLYRFDNTDQTLFAGDLILHLPEGAQDVNFSRLAGGQLTPIEPLTQVGDAWHYENGLLPGEMTLTLLVRYIVPYNSSFELAHPVEYPVQLGTMVLPAGLSLQGEGWQNMGNDMIEGAEFTNFEGVIDREMAVFLGGSAEFIPPPTSPTRLVRNTNQELIIGGAALVLTLAFCTYLLVQWQRQAPPDPTPILQQIAALDDAYAAGDIKRKPYEKHRAQLLQQVRDRWHP